MFDEDRYFDVFVEYAKAGARRPADQDQRLQSRPGSGAAARAADALVPQHLVVGGRRREAGARSASAAPGQRRSARTTPTRSSRNRSPTTTCTARATCRCSSPRTRPTTSGCSARRTRRRTSRTASTTTSSTATQTRSIPRRQGTKVAAALRAHRRRRRDAGRAPAADRRARPAQRPSRSPTSTPSFATRLRRGGRVLRGDHAARGAAPMRTAPTSCARRWPACSGPSSTSTTTSTLWLEEHGVGRRVCRRTSAGACATASGSTCSTTTSSRCRTSGSIRGTRRGTWRFTCCRWRMVDPDFAKQQLDLMLRNDYLHPNGQMPAYEWNFGDVNPPVHAYATMQIYLLDKERSGGKGDIEFLKYAFSKLLINFTWWVNRKDRAGNNVFEGGFLGLDNIGVFDRSVAAADRRLPGAGRRHGLDGVLQPADAAHRGRAGAARPALRGVRRQVLPAHHVDRRRHGPRRRAPGRDVGRGGRLLLRRAAPARTAAPCGSRCARWSACCRWRRSRSSRRTSSRSCRRSASARARSWRAIPSSPPTCTCRDTPGVAGRRMLSIVNETKLRRILARMLDENEFFGPHGIRALSRYHLEHPFVFHHGGQEYRVGLRAGRFRHRHVRRQLQLARAGLDARQLPAVHRRCCGSTPTTATTSRSNARPARGR